MKYMRGLSPSDFNVATKQWICLEEDKVRVKKDGRNTTQKNTKPRVFTQILQTFVVIFFVLNVVAPVFAQSTFGSVRGLVQDNTGALISTARLYCNSTDENTERTVNADTSGNFIFENVKAGHYSLHCTS